MKPLLPAIVTGALAIALSGAPVTQGENDNGFDVKNADDSALLARARLLTQEELELSRRAIRQGGSEKVRQLAKDSVAQCAELDKRLTDLATENGVPQPEPGSKPLFQRLDAIEAS